MKGTTMLLPNIRVKLPVFEEEETPPLTDRQIYLLEMGLKPTQSLYDEGTYIAPKEDTNHD